MRPSDCATLRPRWICTAPPLCAPAAKEALDRETARASSVAFLLRRHHRSAPLPAVDLSRHPEAEALDVRPHDLETYDELARPHDDDAES